MKVGLCLGMMIFLLFSCCMITPRVAQETQEKALWTFTEAKQLDERTFFFAAVGEYQGVKYKFKALSNNIPAMKDVMDHFGVRTFAELQGRSFVGDRSAPPLLWFITWKLAEAEPEAEKKKEKREKQGKGWEI